MTSLPDNVPDVGSQILVLLAQHDRIGGCQWLPAIVHAVNPPAGTITAFIFRADGATMIRAGGLHYDVANTQPDPGAVLAWMLPGETGQ